MTRTKTLTPIEARGVRHALTSAQLGAALVKLRGLNAHCEVYGVGKSSVLV